MPLRALTDMRTGGIQEGLSSVRDTVRPDDVPTRGRKEVRGAGDSTPGPGRAKAVIQGPHRIPRSQRPVGSAPRVGPSSAASSIRPRQRLSNGLHMVHFRRRATELGASVNPFKGCGLGCPNALDELSPHLTRQPGLWKEAYMTLIVDAHEDVAYNMVALGRDVRRSALETRRLEQGSDVPERNGTCMVGLPEWLKGEVAVVFGTIYAAPARRGSPPGPQSYADPAGAHTLGTQQLDVYRRLADEEEHVALVGRRNDLNQVLESWDGGSQIVGIVPLMEGADPIREPAEAEWWFERGLRLVGLSWKAGTRYAGGDAAPGPLTDLGRELLAVMADLGMALDVSHLAEASFFEAVDRYEGVVVATHANPRALVPGARQLSDEMIRRLAERDGVVGIVPANSFLRPDWKTTAPTLDDVVAAIDHVCQVVGDAKHVGLGSDFDGGFGAEDTPATFDTVADLQRIAPALGKAGYEEEHAEAIMAGNWLRVLRDVLPE